MQIEDASRSSSTAECGSLWVDILRLQVVAVPVGTQQAWLGSIRRALRPGSHQLGHQRQPGELRVEQGCASLLARSSWMSLAWRHFGEWFGLFLRLERSWKGGRPHSEDVAQQLGCAGEMRRLFILCIPCFVTCSFPCQHRSGARVSFLGNWAKLCLERCKDLQLPKLR